MPRGRPRTSHVLLSDQDRQTLFAWQRSTTLPAGIARRGRALLLVAEGKPILHIAKTVGRSRRFIYKWIERFKLMGVEGLKGKPHGGRYARIDRPHSAPAPTAYPGRDTHAQ